MSKRKQAAQPMNLNTLPDGSMMIGLPGSDAKISGSPDGSVCAGISSIPVLARSTTGIILVALPEGLAARLWPDGGMQILTKSENVRFSPGSAISLTSGDDGDTYGDVVHEIMRIADLDPDEGSALSENLHPVDEKSMNILSKSTGSIKISTDGVGSSVICRSDGSVYVGSRRKALLGRLPTGDVLVNLNGEIAAIIRPTGELTICTRTDNIDLTLGRAFMLSTGLDAIFLDDVIDRLAHMRMDIMEAPPSVAEAQTLPETGALDPVDQQMLISGQDADPSQLPTAADDAFVSLAEVFHREFPGETEAGPSNEAVIIAEMAALNPDPEQAFWVALDELERAVDPDVGVDTDLEGQADQPDDLESAFRMAVA